MCACGRTFCVCLFMLVRGKREIARARAAISLTCICGILWDFPLYCVRPDFWVFEFLSENEINPGIFFLTNYACFHDHKSCWQCSLIVMWSKCRAAPPTGDWPTKSWILKWFNHFKSIQIPQCKLCIVSSWLQWISCCFSFGPLPIICFSLTLRSFAFPFCTLN